MSAPELPAAPQDDGDAGGPGFAGQVTALLEAIGADGMLTAARELRGTTMGAYRALSSSGLPPVNEGIDARIARVRREVQAGRLADMALDVITALDYLLFLLAPVMPPERLAGDAAPDDDLRARRQLDARAVVVRRCRRLLDMAAEAAR
jgi:hypothetical protein